MTVKESTFSKPEMPNKPWIETPLVESSALSRAAGCRVFLKLENLQPSGSFKSRGIGNFILARLEELRSKNPNSISPPHIFSSSGGNAGLAAVHASRALGLPCTVVVPLSTKPLMISKLQAAGAYEVIQHGPTWKDADTYLHEEVIAKAGKQTIYAPPFDHPDIWTGHSSLIHELHAQLPAPPSILICSVGGGGLFNGICQGLDAVSWTPHTTVLAMETLGADSLSQSVKAGELVTLPGITSQATSLGATRVLQKSLEYAQRGTVKSVVLPDAEAAMGCWRLADDERVMVEMACGVNVALCYDGRLEKVLGRKVDPEETVVIVLCGGSNVTVDMLGKWREEFGWVEKTVDVEVPSSVTAPNGA